MSTSIDPAENHGGQRAYPLGALFVLVAASAVLLAMVSPLARAIAAEKVRPVEVIGASVLAGLLCMIIGMVVGMHHYRRWIGGALGAATGLIVGAVIGPLALIPQTEFFSLVAACLTGSLVLLAVGAGIRLASQSTDNDGRIRDLETPTAIDETADETTNSTTLTKDNST